MQRLWILTLGFLLGSMAFASHFTGSYSDAQTGTTITIQQDDDGRLQGTYSGQYGQFQFMGEGNQQGTYGSMMTQQGILGFQAQLSPDNQQLQFAMFQLGPDGQPAPLGQAIMLQRAGAGAAMPAPGMPAPGIPGPVTQMPGEVQQPGLPLPPAGAIPVTPAPPQAGALPAIPGQPAMPPVSAVPGAWPGIPASEQPAAGGAWSQPLVGDAGQLVMLVQPGQQGSYSGWFDAYGQRHPFFAQGNDSWLEGSYQTDNGQYGFYAERQPDGTVWLFTGDTQYILQPGAAGPGQWQP